jgi:hypothetical protein
MSIYEPTHTEKCDITRSYVPEHLVELRKRGVRLSIACSCGAVERAQRDDEAWMHAACLSIADGVPGWEKPLEHDSLAMRTVRALRLAYEEARADGAAARLESEELAGALSNLQMHYHKLRLAHNTMLQQLNSQRAVLERAKDLERAKEERRSVASLLFDGSY